MRYNEVRQRKEEHCVAQEKFTDMDALGKQVVDTLCAIAFTPASGSALGQQVRCLEILAKLLGLYDRADGAEAVTIVEDL